jgi:hypothetical protein
MNQNKSMTSKNEDSRKRAFFRFRWVSVAIVSAILTLSGWALSSPIGSSPDDDFHLPSIWCGQGFRDGICEQSSETNKVEVPYTSFANSSCFAFNNEISGKCVYDATLKPTDRVNLVQDLYPPVYYWTMSWFASSDIATSTLKMRVSNSVIAVLALAILISAIPIHARRVPLVTLLITAVPLGVFLIASTNPSGWAYFSLIFFVSAFNSFITATTTKSRIVLGSLAGVFSLMAGGTRADASIFVVLAIFLAFTLSFSRRVFSRTNIIYSFCLLAVSMFFYFSVETGSGVVSGTLGNPVTEEGPAPSIFVTLAGIPNLWVGIFGVSGLGWLDTPMPAIVWALTLGIFLSMIFSSVGCFNLKQSFAVGAALAFLTAIPLYILTQSGLEVGQQVQPRYLLPLIALFSFTALYRGSQQSGVLLTRAQIMIIGVGLFVSNSIALHINARRYITGMDVMGVNLDSSAEWWWRDFPLSANTVWLVATLGSALLLLSIWKLRQDLGISVKINKKDFMQSA